MAAATTSTPAHRAAPETARLELDAPWAWLAAGWRDLWRRPALSLGYGLAVATAGWLLAALLIRQGLSPALLPLAGGFLLVGPMLAVGLCEMSRRYERGLPFRPAEVLFVATRSPVQLGFVGVVLALFMLAWLRFAMLLFALFFGLGAMPPLDAWIGVLLFTGQGLAFLAVGTALGGLLAAAAFALSVVTIPLLMTRDVDAVTAMLTSLRAVARNPRPMLLWAWLIAMLGAVGLVTLFAGLIVTFPLLGHATWHAYRATVREGD